MALVPWFVLLSNACSTAPAACTFRSETRAAWKNGHISNKVWRGTGVINTNTHTYRKSFKNTGPVDELWDLVIAGHQTFHQNKNSTKQKNTHHMMYSSSPQYINGLSPSNFFKSFPQAPRRTRSEPPISTESKGEAARGIKAHCLNRAASIIHLKRLARSGRRH